MPPQDHVPADLLDKKRVRVSSGMGAYYTLVSSALAIVMTSLCRSFAGRLLIQSAFPACLVRMSGSTWFGQVHLHSLAPVCETGTLRSARCDSFLTSGSLSTSPNHTW